MEVYGYIYMVRNKVNGKIYFGKTENNFKTRYRGNITKYTHNEHLQNSIKKYGIENFEINEQFDVAYNENDLLDLEDMYMCIYNTLDRRYGYNKQRSGSKHKGHGKHSEESKRKNSESQKTLYKQGYVSPMRGKIPSSETRQKQREKMIGRTHTEESKHKMSEARKGENNPRARKVICLETKQVFGCAKDACEWCGIKSNSDILKCCKGKRKTVGSYHWMYYDDYLKQQNKELDSIQ